MHAIESRAPSADPNVTPMIDVLLVLLVIFMLMAPMRMKMDVQVPDPNGRPGDGVGIVLEVGAGGRLAINQQPVTERDLGARLRALYGGRPEKTLVVRGERDATYQDVVAAVDSARGAGVTVVGLDPRYAAR